MTLRNCSICFVKPVFFAGETVSGKVNLLLEKNKSCTALMLNIQGSAECKWSESRNTGGVHSTTHHRRKNRTTIYHRANETYFETFNNLMANQHMTDGTSDLTAGNHSFDFALCLPNNLPSSLEGNYGYVRYTAKVMLKRKYKFDLCYKISFTVLSHTDLNLNPQMSFPAENDERKNLYLLFFNRGTLYMNVKIPFSGYVSGQSIPVTCSLKNESKVKVKSVKASLVKKITFYAGGKQKYESSNISHSESGETYSGEEKIHTMSIYVPPTPTNSIYCSIIDIMYELKVTAVVSGMHGNLSCTIPITIGTVPLLFNSTLPIVDQPSASNLCVPSAPPAYLDTDPPSYEEAVIGKRMEEDFEDWDYTKEFLPKYPVYNFDKKK